LGLCDDDCVVSLVARKRIGDLLQAIRNDLEVALQIVCDLDAVSKCTRNPIARVFASPPAQCSSLYGSTEQGHGWGGLSKLTSRIDFIAPHIRQATEVACTIVSIPAE
jgi:hypothetical protein